jgi:hypothetical protein
MQGYASLITAESAGSMPLVAVYSKHAEAMKKDLNNYFGHIHDSMMKIIKEKVGRVDKYIHDKHLEAKNSRDIMNEVYAQLLEVVYGAVDFSMGKQEEKEGMYLKRFNKILAGIPVLVKRAKSTTDRVQPRPLEHAPAQLPLQAMPALEMVPGISSAAVNQPASIFSDMPVLERPGDENNPARGVPVSQPVVPELISLIDDEEKEKKGAEEQKYVGPQIDVKHVPYAADEKLHTDYSIESRGDEYAAEYKFLSLASRYLVLKYTQMRDTYWLHISQNVIIDKLVHEIVNLGFIHSVKEGGLSIILNSSLESFASETYAIWKYVHTKHYRKLKEDLGVFGSAIISGIIQSNMHLLNDNKVEDKKNEAAESKDASLIDLTLEDPISGIEKQRVEDQIPDVAAIEPTEIESKQAVGQLRRVDPSISGELPAEKEFEIVGEFIPGEAKESREEGRLPQPRMRIRGRIEEQSFGPPRRGMPARQKRRAANGDQEQRRKRGRR